MKKTMMPLLLLVVLAGCAADADDNADVAADSAAVSETPAPAPAPAVTDAQIAAIVVAANDVDIKGGELAKGKSTNAEVKAFAVRMISDHTAVNKSAVDLVTKLGVTPEPSATSQETTTKGDASRATLTALSGAAFDKAYADAEVVYHEWLLGAIDTVLLPSAQNAELKALLEQTRPAVVSHLEHAKKLQTTLAGQH